MPPFTKVSWCLGVRGVVDATHLRLVMLHQRLVVVGVAVVGLLARPRHARHGAVVARAQLAERVRELSEERAALAKGAV